MAKLYWRIKKDGKWTFRACRITYLNTNEDWIHVKILTEEEE